MKRSLAILVSALSISAMTVPMTLPVWAEAADTKEEASDTQDLEDGVYIVDFNTDSSMFHTNEACEGKGQLRRQNDPSYLSCIQEHCESFPRAC